MTQPPSPPPNNQPPDKKSKALVDQNPLAAFFTTWIVLTVVGFPVFILAHIIALQIADNFFHIKIRKSYQDAYYRELNDIDRPKIKQISDTVFNTYIITTGAVGALVGVGCCLEKIERNNLRIKAEAEARKKRKAKKRKPKTPKAPDVNN